MNIFILNKLNICLSNFKAIYKCATYNPNLSSNKAYIINSHREL